MEITNIGRIQDLTYLQTVNKDNVAEQEARNIDNLVKFKGFQEDLIALNAMESGYEAIKIQATIQASEDFLEMYGVGGTIDVSA